MIYLLFKENVPDTICYTSIRPLCEANKLPYYGLTQVNKPMLIAGIKYEIKGFILSKIKGRGKAFR